MRIPMERPPDRRRRTGEQGARLGGRSERVVREVLRATAAELARVGYAALRIEDVAARAGVNKTTVYRRWPAKADLVGAALRSMHEVARELPDTGSVRSDLLHMLKERVAHVSTPERQSLARVIMAEMDQPELVAIARALRKEYQAPWRELITRAVARGELPEGSDAGLMVEVIMSTVFTRLLRLREPIDDAFMSAVVDLVVLGAKSGGAKREPE
jgi:AcrR family transcriptional regulator